MAEFVAAHGLRGRADPALVAYLDRLAGLPAGGRLPLARGVELPAGGCPAGRLRAAPDGWAEPARAWDRLVLRATGRVRLPAGGGWRAEPDGPAAWVRPTE